MLLFTKMNEVFNKRLLSAAATKKLTFPAADKNKPFILEVLQNFIDPSKFGKLLEVSSGTGQQALYFANHFPQLTIQTSEFDASLFDSIKAYATEAANKNVRDPVLIDAQKGPWNVETDFDYILNVNMFHVTPFECSIGFFKYGSQVLKSGGKIFTYGAYAMNGVIEPESNVLFNRNLRKNDPRCGIRNIEDLQKVAADNGIELKKKYDLPANNKCLVWEKN